MHQNSHNIFFIVFLHDFTIIWTIYIYITLRWTVMNIIIMTQSCKFPLSLKLCSRDKNICYNIFSLCCGILYIVYFI